MPTVPGTHTGCVIAPSLQSRADQEFLAPNREEGAINIYVVKDGHPSTKLPDSHDSSSENMDGCTMMILSFSYSSGPVIGFQPIYIDAQVGAFYLRSRRYPTALIVVQRYNFLQRLRAMLEPFQPYHKSFFDDDLPEASQVSIMHDLKGE